MIKSLTIREWHDNATQNLNSCLTACIENAQHATWREDYITSQLLIGLSGIGTEITWTDLNRKVTWSGYKLSGKSETTYGDIALFVRTWLTATKYIDGVAYYEAKKQYFGPFGDSIGFNSITEKQLSRLSSLTNASSILLYDVTPTEGRAHATSLPTKIVNELIKNKINTNSGNILHQFGTSWINQLSLNLRGMWLDYSTDAIQNLKATLDSQNAPFAVISAKISLAQIDLVKRQSLLQEIPEQYELLFGQENKPKNAPQAPYTNNDPEPF